MNRSFTPASDALEVPAVRSLLLAGMVAMAIASLPSPLAAADGDLDTTFSGDGLTSTVFGATADLARGVAIQADGKIVVVGRTETGGGNAIAVARYLEDGSLDTSFSGDGKDIRDVGLGNDEAWSVAVQGDGKIVVAGCVVPDTDQRLGILRYLDDGTLDTSFHADGVVLGPTGTCAYGLALQDDGKIVVAGFGSTGFSILTARYESDGDPDPTFSGDGFALADTGLGSEEGWDVAVQGDGKIVVAGCSIVDAVAQVALLRYTAAGVPDTTFDGDGVVLTDVSGNGDCAHAVALQNDGKIVAAGDSENLTGALVARYGAGGSLDTSFSGDGFDVQRPGSEDAVFWGLALHANGKIAVAGGSLDRILVARYGETGVLDTTFGPPNGYVTENFGAFYAFANDLALEGDSKLVVTGHFGSMGGPVFATARYLSEQPVFADGFESGDTDAWAQVVP